MTTTKEARKQQKQQQTKILNVRRTFWQISVPWSHTVNAVKLDRNGHAIVALISNIPVSSEAIVATSISSEIPIQTIVYFCPVLMDSLGDCLSVTKNARCYGLIVVAAQYNVQYLCFQHLKNVEGVELPSFDDLVKLKHDPGLSSVKRTILGAGHYSEHIARWMRYYNAKQVSPVYM